MRRRRINISEQARQVICAILDAAGGRLEGKVRLFKAFYHAHLNYWRSNKDALTEYPIVRMERGPGIKDADRLIEALQKNGSVRVVAPKRPYDEFVFELKTPCDFERSSDWYKAIKDAVEHVQTMSASELSEQTHAESRSWIMGAPNDELNVFIDTLDEAEYEAIHRRLDAADTIVEGMFR